ncbi:gliding motility-associated C-terminal domain-containing protein [Emticicia sp. 21SJ11W-3]|uniref:T9SS type B sorting domain-containing protein n=1 Tax=Emticicia sp. 21SJ11W-3 TaxID=2916755 RepID=UPI00209DE326|nr:gliding motility-associated C-terminal domain-containing protein [Emticicia sp. 21SJ11W-3]UTA68345.1 gliding motility-associated C-terminal domain-containing protein [Emticicia sp. 21SJ11W-3]
MRILRFTLFFFIAGLLIAPQVQATHLRAGEITAKRISSTTLTYRVTLTTYTDQINGYIANDAANTSQFSFGVTGVPLFDVKRRKKFLINAGTMCNVYDTTYTFPGPGRYTISCAITNRNANTVNLQGPTDQISFFVETTIVVNGALGLNNTPVLLNIPVDTAGVGRRFIHNPGAFDADGDSLAYRLTMPKRGRTDGSNGGEFAAGYKDPSTLGDSRLIEGGGGPSFFTINAETGDLIWDSPGRLGVNQYQVNVAFIVEEWRKGNDGSYTKIGEITRDMQIIVVETPNRRPILTVPGTLCVEAGQKVEFNVTASDPDNQNIRITTTGGVYNQSAEGAVNFIAPEAAKFTPLNAIQKSPATGTFSWETNCRHVREQPYDVLFKVEDYPGRFSITMTDTRTVRIRVIPPRPQGLSARSGSNGVELRWSKYPDCNLPSEDIKIDIYRKEGCSNYIPGTCQLGLPESLGFVKIGSVSARDTFYLDNKTQNGVIYSYSIVATLATTEFTVMNSVPSNEACIGSELPQKAPVITNVSVERTHSVNGVIQLKWTRPLNFDSTATKGPYAYKLYRATGISGGTFQLIATIPTRVNKQTADTVYTDNGLNTEGSGYTYRVSFLYETDKVLAESQIASSVRLTARSDAQRIRLSWQANVPWSNDNRKHVLYREDKSNPGVFHIIAEVPVQTVNTYNYIDDGQDRYDADGNQSIQMEVGVSYCYKIKTVGSYTRLPQYGILENYSQESCGIVIDDSPPCPPQLTIDALNCQELDREAICRENRVQNTLSWTTPISSGENTPCRTDIVGYNLYYSRYKGETGKLLIRVTGVPPAQTYTHERSLAEGFAGCYYVTALSSLNRESVASNVVCKDNCPAVELPNVITPNGDGKNDTFSPMTCEAFIQEIGIEIYNRYGLKVYESSGTKVLSWDGRSSDGKELPSGTYYYVARVTMQRLEKTDEVPVAIKGWVELIR